jgi:hypothetical protein
MLELCVLLRGQIAYRTPLAVGFIIGVGIMMIQLLISNAVLAAGEKPVLEGQQALAAFSILKLLGLVSVTESMSRLTGHVRVNAHITTTRVPPSVHLQTTFTTFVILFRDILLPAPMSTMEHESSLPPPQTFVAGGAGTNYGGTGAGGDIGGPPVSSSYRDEHITVTGGGGVL